MTAEPLFNRTGGYKSYVFPAVAVIIVQQTLLFGAATFMGGRRREGRWRMRPLEFVGSLAALASVGILNCLFLFGLAIAGVNPTAVAAGNALSGAGLGVMLPAAGVGAVLMPYITGAVAQRFGIWAGMLCTVFALMGMTACAVALHRRNDMK